MPPQLLDAVRSLHERIEAHASARIEEAVKVANGEIASATTAARQLQAQLSQREAENARVQDALNDAEESLRQLRAQNHEQSIKIATVNSECMGLASRLADRTAEAASNHAQLVRTMSQFEHFQKAAASQRSDEHDAFERRIAGLEHELLRAREHVGNLQGLQVEMNAKAATLAEKSVALEIALEGFRADHAALRADQDRHQLEESRLREGNDKLNHRVTVTNEELALTKTALAVTERELILAKEQRLAAEGALAARIADLAHIARRLPGRETRAEKK